MIPPPVKMSFQSSNSNSEAGYHISDDNEDDDSSNNISNNSEDSVFEAISEQEIIEFDRILLGATGELDRQVLDHCEGPNTPRSIRVYRFVLRWLGHFCRVDFFKSDQEQTRRHEEAPCWPIWAKLYYLYCTLKVSINVYYQYSHDLNLYKARTLRNYLASVTANKSSSSASAVPTNDYLLQREYQVIERRIVETREYLDFIGAPFFKLSFFAEIGYFYIHSLSFITYFIGPLFFRFIAPLHFRLAKVILDTNNEKIKCIKATRREIHRYLFSSRIFNLTEQRILASGSDSSLEQQQSPITIMAYEHMINNGNNNNKSIALCDHETTIEQLKLMASRGKLYPLNWSKGLIEQMTPYYLGLILGCHVYGLILMVGIGVCLPLAGDLDTGQYTWSDYLMLAENLYITLVLIIGVSFYCSVVSSSCTDQIMYIRRLKQLVDDCANRNRSRYYFLVGLQQNGTPGSVHRLNCELMARDMNANLLFIFVQFKILVDQLMREIKSYGIFAFITLIIIFNLPIVARLHEPYMSETNKMIQFCFFPATVLYLDTVLVPVCLVHNRTSDLYKSLSYLLAHTIETSRLDYNHQQSTDTTIYLYNAHLVWLLRKELSYPDIFLRKFATSILGIKFTFQTLVKIHLWLGVLMLSILSGTLSGGGTFLGGFLNDPFNILHLPNHLIGS